MGFIPRFLRNVWYLGRYLQNTHWKVMCLWTILKIPNPNSWRGSAFWRRIITSLSKSHNTDQSRVFSRQIRLQYHELLSRQVASLNQKSFPQQRVSSKPSEWSHETLGGLDQSGCSWKEFGIVSVRWTQKCFSNIKTALLVCCTYSGTPWVCAWNIGVFHLWRRVKEKIGKTLLVTHTAVVWGRLSYYKNSRQFSLDTILFWQQHA